jgi:hypothetical protein
VKEFNFRKTVMRNNFTKVFGKVGRRRTVVIQQRKLVTKRTKMQKHRRAAQGWRNQIFGSLQALKIRLQYGRRAPIRKFIK